MRAIVHALRCQAAIARPALSCHRSPQQLRARRGACTDATGRHSGGIRMRRNRCAKIVATLGPASSTKAADPRAGRRRRRRVPLQFQPWQPRGPCRALRPAARGRAGAGPADRHDHGPAGPEAAGRPLRRRPGHPGPGRPASGSISTGARRPASRHAAPSRDLRRAAARPGPAARRRAHQAAGRALRPRFRRDARSSTAAGCPTARASTCPTRCCRSRP